MTVSVFVLVSSLINFNERTLLISFLLKTIFKLLLCLQLSSPLNYLQIFFQIIQINFSNFTKIFLFHFFYYKNNSKCIGDMHSLFLNKRFKITLLIQRYIEKPSEFNGSLDGAGLCLMILHSLCASATPGIIGFKNAVHVKHL